MGRRGPRRDGRPAGDAAGDQALQRRLRRGARAARWPGVQIAGDLGDQQAATFGQTCFSPGEAKNTYGTGNFLLLNTGTEAVPSKNGLLTTVGYKIGDQDAVYCLEGAIAITGALVQWLRDNLKMIKAAPEVEDLAQLGRGQRRLLHRAGVLGPVRAVLEVERPRCLRGSDALRQRRPHRPRDAGGDGLPEPRGGRGDEQRLRRRARVAQGRRRHGRQRPADAVPGRPAGRAGDPAEGARDDVARRRLRGRAGHGSGARSRTCARTGSRTSAGSRPWTPRSATSTTSTGSARSRARSTGSTRSS